MNGARNQSSIEDGLLTNNLVAKGKDAMQKKSFGIGKIDPYALIMGCKARLRSFIRNSGNLLGTNSGTKKNTTQFKQ